MKKEMDPNQAENSDNETLGILEHYISITTGDELCNVEWVSYSQYLKNRHPTKSIWVQIEIITHITPPVPPTYREYTVAPKAEEFIGCPIPGPTAQRFYYSIKNSRWA